MNMESKLGKIVEAFDQKVGRDYLVLRLFFLSRCERGSSKEDLYDDAIKPGSIVVDRTDIVDDDIVDFPFFVDEVQFVIDRHFFGLVGNHLCVDYFCIVRVLHVTSIRTF